MTRCQQVLPDVLISLNSWRRGIVDAGVLAAPIPFVFMAVGTSIPSSSYNFALWRLISALIFDPSSEARLIYPYALLSIT